MSAKLPDTEIKHRLTKLRNYESDLYLAARGCITKLEGMVKDLQTEKQQWLEERARFLSGSKAATANRTTQC